MRTSQLGLLVLAAAGILLPAARAYTFTTVQYPGANQTYLTAFNASSVALGKYVDPTSGAVMSFVYKNGKFALIAVPGAEGTDATGINDSDEICGSIHVSNGTTGTDEGFVLIGKTAQAFTVPKTRATYPQAVNNSGYLSGYANTKTLSAPVYEGFVLTSPTSTTPIKIKVTGQTNTLAFGIDNNGDVVGFAGANLNTGTPLEGFIYTAATKTLATVSDPSAVQTRFYGINDSGVAVGYTADVNGNPTGFTYQNGVFTPFSSPGYLYTIPQAINDNGVIVGYAATSTTTIVGFIAVP